MHPERTPTNMAVRPVVRPANWADFSDYKNLADNADFGSRMQRQQSVWLPIQASWTA
jgi:hypothetical protein